MNNTINITERITEQVTFRTVEQDLMNLDNINSHFAYDNRGQTARNAMRAGINLFLKSPELFREWLSPVSVNENYNQSPQN